jgi:hypothetical protein
MNVRFKKDGYIAKILTWGMPQWKKTSYVKNLQNGCPMFWRFLFMFAWSLGGLRKDGVDQSSTVMAKAPKKPSATMMRINEAVSDFSETKTAQHIGKGVGMTISGLVIAVLLAFAGGMLFAIGKGIYLIFAGGMSSVMTAGAVIGIIAVACASLYYLGKGFVWLKGKVTSTEAWGLFIQKVKSLKEKTCPVVAFA